MVLSIAHMSMVIFPIIFYIFHMSGVKKKRKNQKKYLRAAPSIVRKPLTEAPDVKKCYLSQPRREEMLRA